MQFTIYNENKPKNVILSKIYIYTFYTVRLPKNVQIYNLQWKTTEIYNFNQNLKKLSTNPQFFLMSDLQSTILPNPPPPPIKSEKKI